MRKHWFVVMLCLLCLESLPARQVLSVDFNDVHMVEAGIAKDVSGRNNDGKIAGSPEIVEGFDGSSALWFNNKDVAGVASQYIDFGNAKDLQLGKKDFTIVFWCKAIKGGGLDWVAEDVPADSLLKFYSMGYGAGVYVSNKSCRDAFKSGFALCNVPYSYFFTMNMVGKDTTWVKAASTVRQINGVMEPEDGRWHLVAVTCNRKGMCSLYVDGVRKKQVDVSLFAADDISGNGSFVVGSDAFFHYGLQNNIIDSFRVYDEAVDGDALARLYAVEGLQEEKHTILLRLGQLEPGVPYPKESLDAMRAFVGEASSVGELRKAYDAFLLKEDAQAVVMLVSDTHITNTENSNAKYLRTVLQDSKRGGYRCDAVAITGDLTDVAKRGNMNAFFDILDGVDGLVCLPILGNHDVRTNMGGNYKDSVGAFLERRKKYVSSDTLWYAKEIHGITFLGISSIEDDKSPVLLNAAVLNDDVIAWVRQKTDSHVSGPLFFLCHQPASHTCFGSGEQNNLGNREASVLPLLEREYPVVMINGHTHNGLGSGGLMRVKGNLWQLNIPSTKGRNRGYASQGTAYIMYVYEHAIVFRARDALKGEWIPDYDAVLPLQTMIT